MGECDGTYGSREPGLARLQALRVEVVCKSDETVVLLDEITLREERRR